MLRVISDDLSFDLFKLIARKGGTTEELKSMSNLTHKQYYSRLFRLVQTGLIKKKDNKYCLTALGKVLYDTQLTIEIALNSYWKIKAIDSLEISDGLPKEEHNKIVESLIEDKEIKRILVGPTQL